MFFPVHEPKQIEFIQQREQWDCGIACIAMLAGLLYENVLPFFKDYDHKNGLFPEDVLEFLEDIGISYNAINKLPKRQPALVALDWKEGKLTGHYVVWDPIRKQFLDPLHGLIGRRKLLSLCKIDHIWSIKKTKQLIGIKRQKGEKE